MPTTKPGQKEYRVVFDVGSEEQLTLIEWGRRRGLQPGKALKCIAVDFSDALNGKPNPFAVAIAAAAGVSMGNNQQPGLLPSYGEEALSEEEQARRTAALEAVDQF